MINSQRLKPSKLAIGLFTFALPSAAVLAQDAPDPTAETAKVNDPGSFFDGCSAVTTALSKDDVEAGEHPSHSGFGRDPPSPVEWERGILARLHPGILPHP